MIESVQLRQRGAYEFESHYDNLCAMQDSCPLPAVKAHLSQAVLDINGDRVRVNDWAPILNTLRINKSLEFIAVRSYYTPPSDENEKKTLIEKRKMPSIRSKEITYRLCKALKECLMCTPNLSCLEIQGLPLRERDLQTLMKGLAKNNTLHHLSLEFCRIGDSGLEVVCKGIKNSTAISSINLTGCSLSNKGAESLSKIIKHQAMKRHNEAWRDSLRYRRPDLDRMPGIRRITINNNPMLGDQGASLLAEALKDDLWLKALDMQSCGISTSGAKQLLDVLKYNTTVVVLDVRRNPLIDRDVVHSIMEQLMINCNGQDTEYKWIKGDEGLNGVKGKSAKKRTKTLNSSFGRKTTIRVSSGAQRRRTKSAGAVGVTRRIQPISSEDIKSGPGMPWRTALRANRYRGYPPEHIHGKMSQYENSEGSLLTSPDQTQSFLMREEDEDEDTLRELQRIKLDDSNLDTGVANVKDLQIELIQMRRKMQQEHLCRARSDKKIVELTLENKRLREDIARQKLEGGGNALDDESVLETIEASFKQFHEFLDLLREAGLGQLITMAGLDHKDSPFTQALPMAQRNSQRSLYATSPSKIPPRPVKPTFKTSSYCGDISSSGNIGESASPFDKKLREFQGGSYLADNSDFSHPANISDPTMVGEFEESNKGPMRKDELYDKILHETSGMFSHIDDQNVLARDYTQSKDPSKSESPKAANTWSPVLDKQTKERSPKSDRGRESIMSGTEEHSIGLREEIVHDLDDIDKSEKDMSEPPSKPKPQPRARKVSEEESFKDRKGKLAKDDSEKESPEHKSRLSDYNYSMESFDHSYMSEREEVIHLEQDLDLYGEPLSPPAQVINSDEEDF